MGSGESSRPRALVSNDSSETCAPKDRATTARSAASCTLPRLPLARRHPSTARKASAPARRATAVLLSKELGKASTTPARNAATPATMRRRRSGSTSRSRIWALMSSVRTRQVPAESRAGHAMAASQPPPAATAGSTPAAAPTVAAIRYSTRATGTKRLARSPGMGSHQAASWGRRKSGPSRPSEPTPTAASSTISARNPHPGSRPTVAKSPSAPAPTEPGRATSIRRRYGARIVTTTMSVRSTE